MNDAPASHAERKMQFLFALRSKGVTDARVLSAMERIDRARFLRGLFAERAEEDTPLPIACGQTISQPSVVGLMTQALNVQPRDKVLEIGTGSGYQAAVLSRLCRRVYSIERHRDLMLTAQQRFSALGIHNVTTMLGDGWKGWPEQAPFDRIIVTAAAAEIPEALTAQLAVGGVMVIPVGAQYETQDLLQIRKTDAGLDIRTLFPVRFVPMLHGVPPAGR